MKIQSKRSNVLDGGVAKAPTAEQMEYGELAINYSAVDPAFFIKDSSNTIVKLDINDISSALQAGDNVSALVNDAGYITNADLPPSSVISVNGKNGVVTLNAADVGAATIAQGDKADSATQPGDNVSTLANDAGYITSAAIPAPLVVSVNNKIGAVVLDATDVGALKAGDNVSTLVNDAGYITDADIPGSPVISVNGATGAVVLTAFSVGAATTSQGVTADSALQPGDDVSTLVNNAGYITLGQVPAPPVDSVNNKTGAVVLTASDVGALKAGDNVSALVNDAGYITDADIPGSPVVSVNGKTGTVVLSASDVGAATTAQGTKADSALQPGDNISELSNNAGYITAAGVPAAPVSSVNGATGTVVLTAFDVGAATTAQGATADSATQPGDNVSTLNNDAGYIAAGGAPVQSVNGATGTVVLSASDVGAATAAQGALADSATQPGDNVSTLNNNAGYITDAGVTSIIAGDNISVDQATGAVTVSTAPNVGAVAILQDRQTTNSSGTAGVAVWNDRELNTVDDVSNLVSLNANKIEFTLQAGTYLIDWFSVGLQCGRMVSKLTNVSAGSTAGLGSATYSNGTGDYTTAESHGTARVQIASASTFKIEQNMQTNSSWNMGIALQAGTGVDSIFAQVVVHASL